MANDTPSLDILKKQLEDIIAKMRLSKDATRLLREQIDALKNSGTATSDQLELLTKKLEKQYNQSIKFANEAKRIQNIILKQYPNAPVIDEEKIDRIKKEAAETQKRLNKSFAELRGSFTGETLYFFHKQLQWYLSKAVSIKVLELPSDILKSMSELNKAVEELGVLTRALPGDLEKLKSSLISVTKATSFSMSEVGNTAKFLAQSGLDIGQIIDSLQPIADLAIATSAKIEDAAKAVSTVLVAMDLPANQASKVADILAQSTNLARLNIEDLSTSFNYTAAAAAQLGIPIDKLTSYLAILSNQGLRASTAATGLRQVFETLQAPSEKAIKTLAKYNLTLEDISPLTNDLVSILQKLSTVAKTDLAEIFSTRGGNAIMALLNAGPEVIRQMENNINKQGIAAQMAREQMLTLDNAYKNFVNTIQVTQGILGEKLASPPLVDILTGLSKTLSDITDNQESLTFFQSLFKLFVDLATFVGPTLVSFTALKLAFSGLSAIFPTLNTGFSLLGAAVAGNTEYIKENIKTHSLFSTVLKQEVITSLSATTAATGVLSKTLVGLKTIVVSTFAAFKASLPGLVLTGISVAISSLITYFIKSKQELGELYNLGARVSSEFNRLNNEITQGLNDQIALTNRLTQEYMKQYPELVKLNQERAKVKFTEDKDKLISEFLNNPLFDKASEEYKTEVRINLSAAIDYKDLQQKMNLEMQKIADYGKKLIEQLDDFRITAAENYGSVPNIIYTSAIKDIANSTNDLKTKLKELDNLRIDITKQFSGFDKVAITAFFENYRKQILAGKNTVANELVDTANKIAEHLDTIDSLVKSRTSKGVTLFNSGDVSKYTQDLITLASQIKQIENDINNTTDEATKQKLLATLNTVKQKFLQISNLKIQIETDPKKLDEITKKIYSLENLSKQYTFFSNLIDTKKPLSDLQKLTLAFQQTQRIFTILATTSTQTLTESTLAMLKQALGNADIMFEAGIQKLKALEVITWLKENRKEIVATDNQTLSNKGVALFKQQFDVDPRKLPGMSLKIDDIIQGILRVSQHEVAQLLDKLSGGIKTFSQVNKTQVKEISDELRNLASDIKDLPLIRLVDKKTLNETQYFADVVEKLKSNTQDLKAFFKHLGISEKQAKDYVNISNQFKGIPFSVDQIKNIYEQGLSTKTSNDVLDSTFYTFITEKLERFKNIANPDFQEANSSLIEFLTILKTGLDKLRETAVKDLSNTVKTLKNKNIAFIQDESNKIRLETAQNLEEINSSIIDHLKKFFPSLNSTELLNNNSSINLGMLEQKLAEINVNETLRNKLISEYYNYTQNLQIEEQRKLKLLELQNTETLLSTKLGAVLNQQSDEYLDLQLQIKQIQIDKQIEEAKSKLNNQEIITYLQKQKDILAQQVSAAKALNDIEYKKVLSKPLGAQSIGAEVFYNSWKELTDARTRSDKVKELETLKQFKEYSYGAGSIAGLPKNVLDEYATLQTQLSNLISQKNLLVEGSEEYERINNQINSIRTQFESLNILVNEFNNHSNNISTTFTSVTEGFTSGLTKFSNEVASQFNLMQVSADFAYNAAMTIADGLSNAVYDMITSGKSLEDSFKSILKNLGQMLLQMTIKMMMMRAVFGGVGLFLLKDGGIVSGEGEIPVKKYATGGVARKTQVAVFGEGAMPEAFVPLPNGRSIPVQMKGAASVNQTNIQIIDQRGSGAPVQTEKSTGPNGEELLKVYIRDEVRSAITKGQFDNTFKDAYGLTRSPIRR